ncbi:MAG: ribonuclease P protein component, partial [candidate division Zixibacteria bacterium]|nr:ribonuclease P protein component [candidate division Zixibacteria bacterium]
MRECRTQEIKPFGLRRSRSLRGRDRIRELIKNGKRRNGESLTVFFDPAFPDVAFPSNVADAGKSSGKDDKNLFGNAFRIGVLTPKRLGNAVARNRIRRVIRERIRVSDLRSNLQGDLLIRYNPPSRKQKFTRAELTQLGLRAEKIARKFIR